MNSIPTEQNTARQLQRLAAQRQLYGTAKTLFGWQVFVSGPVAVALAFCVIVLPEFKAYAALWGILVSLSDVFWLTPWQKRLRNKAARVQELFDCDVLVLPWDELKASKRPEPELVKEQADKYSRWAASMPPLMNWYGPEVGCLPLHVARLACQRSNCWWDAKQRRRYAVLVIVGVSAVFLAVLFLAMGNGFTIEDFVLKVAAPLSPALLLGIRQFAEQMEAASRLDTLKEHAERLWNDALVGKQEAEITMKARGLQNEILENRKRSPLVFDSIFKRLRRDYEIQMNHGVAEFVAEAKQKLGLP
ncbi:MAG: S-4TM family putative pore-forming effector [Opitutaceae bacterium]